MPVGLKKDSIGSRDDVPFGSHFEGTIVETTPGWELYQTTRTMWITRVTDVRDWVTALWVTMSPTVVLSSVPTIVTVGWPFAIDVRDACVVGS